MEVGVVAISDVQSEVSRLTVPRGEARECPPVSAASSSSSSSSSCRAASTPKCADEFIQEGGSHQDVSESKSILCGVMRRQRPHGQSLFGRRVAGIRR